MKRVQCIFNHMSSSNDLHKDEKIDMSHSNAVSATNNQEEFDLVEKAMISALESLENKTLENDLTKILPGPLDQPGVTIIPCILRLMKAFQKGQNILIAVKYAETYGHDGIASNIVFPLVITPQSQMPYLDWLVTISNPEDAAKIAKNHVLKSKIYGVAFLGDGVLATRNNESWKEQRQHLAEAFLPKSSLQHIFPVSLNRARLAINERLPNISNSGKTPVEVNEFFLHEAMAQLQLALLGETEEFMNETNIPLRKAFSASLTPNPNFNEALKTRRESRKFIQKYSNDLVKRSVEANKDKPADACVHGPLSARLADLCPAAKNMDVIRRDSAATFFFAGHDTTANLMTWFTFEMAKNQSLQARIHAEVDNVFEELEASKRDMTYDDLAKMKFMTRCIAETLRLWPSVPNGTMREFQYDDTITGRDGKEVVIPKG